MKRNKPSRRKKSRPKVPPGRAGDKGCGPCCCSDCLPFDARGRVAEVPVCFWEDSGHDRATILWARRPNPALGFVRFVPAEVGAESSGAEEEWFSLDEGGAPPAADDRGERPAARPPEEAVMVPMANLATLQARIAALENDGRFAAATETRLGSKLDAERRANQALRARTSHLETELANARADLSGATRECSAMNARNAALEQAVRARATATDEMVSGPAFVLSATPRLPGPGSAHWDGQGSPYLLHLSHAVHVVLPHLVDALLKGELGARLVLVGASAWNAHLVELPLSPRLTTEDLDFEIIGGTVSGDELHCACEAAVQAAASAAECRNALSVLQAVAAASRGWTAAGPDASATEVNAQRRARISAAEATVYAPSGWNELVGCFRIAQSDMGWRIQLAHRTLVDLAPMSEEHAGLVAGADELVQAPLEGILPTRLQFCSPEAVPAVAVPVAPLGVLTVQLKASLESGCRWRLEKDLLRLRVLGQAFFMARLHDPSREIPPAMFELIEAHDPPLAAVVQYCAAVRLERDELLAGLSVK